MKVGIIGVGMVGGTLARYFEEIKGHTRGKNLFLSDADPAKRCHDNVNKADLIFVCVPTPSGKNNRADLSHLDNALAVIKGNKTVVIKSTIPPGTTERYQKKFPNFKILFSPEFLTESRAWEDTLRPDRQIIAHTAKSTNVAGPVLNMLPQAFFSSPGTIGTYQFIRANATEAELGKYGGNLFAAFKVAYANILADAALALSADYENVRKLVAHDRRIGDAWMDVYHNMYRGFGGACLPKDIRAFLTVLDDLAKKQPAKSKNKVLLAKAANMVSAMLDYNEAVLASQGLSMDEVSAHDKDWIKRRLEMMKQVGSKQV